jgi:predicted nuclease of restriction endonuclease-like (RecB) superfamily
MKDDLAGLINELKQIVAKAKYSAIVAVNSEMLKAYYEIGRRIVEQEQKGKSRAKYGEKLINMISKELTREFGKGYSVSSLKNKRLFYLVYKDKKSQTVSGQFDLSWSHYCELIKIDDESKRKYFEKYAVLENLSVRDLKRQIYSLHYERLLLSKDKKALLEYEKKGNIPSKSEDVIKDPYVLDFLGLDENTKHQEKDVESKILDKLQKFLLELGQGFSFVARQKRFTIDNDNFYIDLLLYNIYLKCYFVIELKTEKFKHEDVGQMNFYLNYVKYEINQEGDNEPVGMILCTEKDNVRIKYAIDGIKNKMFVSKYKMYLPKQKDLEREMKKIL